MARGPVAIKEWDREKYTRRFIFLVYLLQPLGWPLDITIWVLKRLNLYRLTQKALYRVARQVLRAYFRVYHRIEVKGMEKVPVTGGAIVAPNHASWLDPLFMWAFLPRMPRAMAKAEEFDMPVLRSLLDLAGAFPVWRGRGDKGAVAQAVNVVRDGHLLLIYPEGTIPDEEDKSSEDLEPTTGLLRGRKGALRVATTTGAPVIPVGHAGSEEALPPRCWPRLHGLPFPRPYKIAVCVGSPIYFHEGRYSVEELDEMTHQLMLAISREKKRAKELLFGGEQNQTGGRCTNLRNVPK